MTLTPEQRREVEQNELFLWDGAEVYSSATNHMIHSLGAIFNRQEGIIRLYTTNHARQMAGANTTFTIRDKLKALGFSFNGREKHWELPLSEENLTKVIELLKQYDTRRWPTDAGMVRCWECGGWFHPRKGDWDGHDWYCGC
jgi:hypothetical protein